MKVHQKYFKTRNLLKKDKLDSNSNQNFIYILRFLAIFCVIINHTAIYVNQFTGELNEFKNTNHLFYSMTGIGVEGVYLFFLISGYCLTYSLFVRNETGYSSFFIRRIFRIVPLYFIFGIIFYFLFRTFKFYYINDIFYIDQSIYNFENIISNFLFIHGFVISANNNVVPGGWSIANEMFYYALFPLLIYFFFKKNISKKRKKISSSIQSKKFFYVLIIVFIFLIINLSIRDSNYLKFIFQKTINPVVFFVCGIFIFKFYDQLKVNLKKINYLSFYLLLILFSINFFYQNIFIKYLALMIIFLNIFIFLEQFSFKNKLMLVLLNFGKSSYGAYLTHFFILDVIGYFLVKSFLNHIFSPLIIFFITLSLVLIMTYIISRLINIYIEKKFINYGARLIEYNKNKI